MMKTLPLLLALALTIGAKAQSGKDAKMANLNDQQITKVLMTLDDGEIDAAKIAMDRAQNSGVKDFAQMMIADHKQNLADTKDVAHKANISPASSDACKALKEDAKTANKDIKKQDKANFDKAYMNEQVTMHEKALSTLTNDLIPNTQNSDLKAHLEKTVDAVKTHLAKAKELQSTLN